MCSEPLKEILVNVNLPCHIGGDLNGPSGGEWKPEPFLEKYIRVYPSSGITMVNASRGWAIPPLCLWLE
jgi:hypothetical protein